MGRPLYNTWTQLFTTHEQSSLQHMNEALYSTWTMLFTTHDQSSLQRLNEALCTTWTILFTTHDRSSSQHVSGTTRPPYSSCARTTGPWRCSYDMEPHLKTLQPLSHCNTLQHTSLALQHIAIHLPHRHMTWLVRYGATPLPHNIFKTRCVAVFPYPPTLARMTHRSYSNHKETYICIKIESQKIHTKETCIHQKRHTKSASRRGPVYITQKRHTFLKRDTKKTHKWDLCTHKRDAQTYTTRHTQTRSMHLKSDTQKRPIYLKRDTPNAAGDRKCNKKMSDSVRMGVCVCVCGYAFALHSFLWTKMSVGFANI